MTEWMVMQTEDGEPWAAFVNGHQDAAALDTPANREAIDVEFKWVFCIDLDGRDGEIRHHHIRCLGDGYEDFPWQFCEASDAGAKPITGIRY